MNEIKKNIIKAIIWDIDGSMMPQGGPIDLKVAEFIRFLIKWVKFGPATGKDEGYARGLACGMGILLDFIIAANGAQFLETINKGSPPAYRRHRPIGTGPNLDEFEKSIRLSRNQGMFISKNDIIRYFRLESKEGVLSLFPPETDVSVTEEWVTFFEEVIKAFGYKLKVIRYSDGCIDIIPDIISKELGIIQVCRLYRIERKNIVVVVDDINDLGLTLGTNVLAVGNAVPRIKEAAARSGGYIASRNNGFGFVEGIYHFAKNGYFEKQTAGKIIKKIEALKIL